MAARTCSKKWAPSATKMFVGPGSVADRRDIEGVGFRTANAIAMRMRMTHEAPQRVRAGIFFVLQEVTGEGHCGLPGETLVTLAAKLFDGETCIVRAALDHAF